MEFQSSVRNEERKRKRELSDIGNLKQEQLEGEKCEPINDTDIYKLQRILETEAKTFLSAPVVISPTELHQVLAAKLAHFDRLLNAYLKQEHKNRVYLEQFQTLGEIAVRYHGPTTDGVPSRLHWLRELLRKALIDVEFALTRNHVVYRSYPNFVNQSRTPLWHEVNPHEKGPYNKRDMIKR